MKDELQDVINIATSKGNYDVNPYMWGMANGLLLAKAIRDNEDPNYLPKPDVFRDDLPKTTPETACETTTAN